MSGKLFAVLLVAIALASAALWLLHAQPFPPAISPNGHAIDREMALTIAESGALFLVAQLMLAVFVWRAVTRRSGDSVRHFPGGATALVAAAIAIIGIEIFTVAIRGQDVWARAYFVKAAPGALVVQAQAEQFAYYFRYPGPDGRFGPMHLDKIDEANLNYFGLDPAADADSRDDIVTAELAVPANRQVHLLLHAKDVGHSFYVRELRLQQDFVPGLDTAIHFTATVPGKYEIVCTQLCGQGHYNMKAYLLVLPPAEFDAWLKQKAAEQ
jgi:cytochrome c oxidase subunit 2